MRADPLKDWNLPRVSQAKNLHLLMAQRSTKVKDYWKQFRKIVLNVQK